MKIDGKILKVLVTLVVCLINHHIFAVEFKTEQEKSIWIKDFFKDKEFEPMSYPIKATEEEKKFELQLITDFINQNGFEHVEPIARGKSISDPEIAKYNTACPDKKPIDMYKEWPCIMMSPASEDDDAGCFITEKMLDDPDNNKFVSTSRCHGNMKIYQFNLYNVSDDKQEYVLYCDDLRTIQYHGKLYDINEKIENFSIVGQYLHFDPNICLYSQYLGRTYPFWDEAVTGIVKYQKKYYFYTIEEDSNDGTSITLWCKDGDLSNTKFYGTRTKGRLK